MTTAPRSIQALLLWTNALVFGLAPASVWRIPVDLRAGRNALGLANASTVG
jgi:hypothetical protein